jgi:cob(I)alamin adenosyltransferase
MKIYTRRGDGGETDLYGGGRVSKASLRMCVVGTVDELNAVLGEVLASMGAGGGTPDNALVSHLEKIQQDLFVIGADLVTIGEKKHRSNDDVPRISAARVAELEGIIDELEKSLEPMTAFIMPGGSLAGAKLHVARSVCRRGERLCVALADGTGTNDGVAPDRDGCSPMILQYLNRLSDLLFVMARFENMKSGVPEKKWLP